MLDNGITQIALYMCGLSCDIPEYMSSFRKHNYLFGVFAPEQLDTIVDYIYKEVTVLKDIHGYSDDLYILEVCSSIMIDMANVYIITGSIE